MEGWGWIGVTASPGQSPGGSGEWGAEKVDQGLGEVALFRYFDDFRLSGDALSQIGRGIPPGEHVHAKWEIAFLEFRTQLCSSQIRNAFVSHHHQVEVGIGFCPTPHT